MPDALPRRWTIWQCEGCGEISNQGPRSMHCQRECEDDSPGVPVDVVSVIEVSRWLMHIDRLDEIAGARWPGLIHNPLWDAGVAIEERFGSGPPTTGEQT